MDNIGKTQNVRLFDVFILAPLMIYTANFKCLPQWLRVFTLVSGFGTLIYNADNYIKQEKLQDEK